MKASTDLLHSLENKLKTANIRSPYLTATVGRSRNRLDLKHLDVLSNDPTPYSQSFLNLLLNDQNNQNLSFDVNLKNQRIANLSNEERFQIDTLFKRCRSILFDNNEDFAEHGTQSFGFGYPLIALRSQQDKTRVIIAPLFIWYLHIETEPNNHSSYILKRTTDNPILLNPQLKNFISQDYGLQLEEIPEEFLDDDRLTREEVLEYIALIQKQIQATCDDLESEVSEIKDRNFYQALVAETPHIFNSGIFTLFKSNKESIISDYQSMISGSQDMMFDDPTMYAPYQEDYFASVPLDPSQESILRNISEHKKVIIQGPPGTGKSNSLTGIILNALENQAQVLVVCEKKTALEVILDNLKEKGLEEFCVVIDNVNSDRQNVVKAMRDKLDNRDYENPASPSLMEYVNNKKRFADIYEKTILQYGNIMKDVMGDMSWKECIGNYLKSKRAIQSHATINSQSTGFKLNAQEYSDLLKLVQDGAYLFGQIEDVYPTFESLNPSVFKTQISTTLVRDVQDKLQKQLAHIQQILESWNQLKSRQTDINAYLEPTPFNRIKAWFNASLKQRIKLAESLMKQIQIMNDPNRFPVNTVRKNMNAHELDQKLDEWKQTVQHVLDHFQSFRPYFEWKKFHSQLGPKPEQDLFEALKKVPHIEWENQFRAWYLNLILSHKELEWSDFPTSDRALTQLQEIEGDVVKLQAAFIRANCYAVQRHRMKDRTLQEMRMLFNLRKNKQFASRNSLRKLYHDEFDIMTAFFPVLLVNPTVCSSMLPLKPGIFDVVIFDEASQLKLEDTFPALLRGRFKVISGDIHQMPPSTHFSTHSGNTQDLDDVEDDVIFAEEESLLTYAQNADFEFNYLDFHYRSQHPHLIDFSNAAFYGKRLVPMPPSSIDTPIIMKEVNGLYDQNCNPTEAEAILQILFNEIQPDEHGQYPSIGIATFNMTQQRFLWEKIWERADQDDEVRQKLALLEAQGLFIKNLENIQGDQRDIIILSTTFGVRPDGKFIQNFGPLNRDTGYKMLNVIVTRAKKQMYVVCSIPRSFYVNYKDDLITKGNTGKGIFYAYLNYARFCSENDEHARQELLSFLAANQGDNSGQSNPTPISANNFLTESVFEEEVIEEMLEWVQPNSIQTQFQLGGFRLDIVILNEAGEPNLVIECDGKQYHKSKVAHRYDIHRQNIIERFGLKVYRIWSTNWWRDKSNEVQKLVRFIKQYQPSALLKRDV